MSIGMILGLILGALGIGSGILGNVLNSNAVEDANSKNLKSVQDTNASNVEQAEMAYKRSLPITQLRTLMDAGFSRAGAMSAISGGGSYSAPTLGSPSAQAKQFDMSSFQSSLERIGGIPSNVEQLEMMKTQRKLIEQEYENNKAEEQRKKEMHQYEMWSRLYNKNIATLTDAFNSRISNYAAQNNVDLSKINTKDDFVRVFGLKNDQKWHSLPKIVQDKFYQDALNQARENREIQSQQNANRAAADAHEISVEQRNKLKAELEDFNSAKNVREKEYSLRALSAQVASIAAARNLTLDKKTIEDNFEFDNDGNIVLENGVPKLKEEGKKGSNTFGYIRGFWNDVADVLPVNVLSQILRFILKG